MAKIHCRCGHWQPQELQDSRNPSPLYCAKCGECIVAAVMQKPREDYFSSQAVKPRGLWAWLMGRA